MAWKAYRLVYQAKSPIHIGWHTLGYIKLTRYYITGKSIWGAMTANLTRALYSYKDYSNVGSELLNKTVLTSYFFPAIDRESPLLPRFTDTALLHGKDDMPVAEFERIFIKSYGQTAVLTESNTAEDESLHESEYISPCVEINGVQRQVFFVGYIFIKEGINYKGVAIDLQNIEQAISEIYVGGDRKYGWGNLSLFGKPQDCVDIFGYTIKDMKSGNLEISLGLNEPIPAHLSINSAAKLKGDIEPLVGMDYETSKGFGQKVSKAEICWMPGSLCLDDNAIFKMGEYGILQTHA